MITIDLKETHRIGVIHAKGTIGGRWIFRHGIKELFSIHIIYKWVASLDSWWRTTFPSGLDRNGEDSIKVMEMVNARLKEAYPEG